MGILSPLPLQLLPPAAPPVTATLFFQVNGVMVTPPYSPTEGLQITQRGRRLIVETNFGFSISYDGHNAAGQYCLGREGREGRGGICVRLPRQLDANWTLALGAQFLARNTPLWGSVVGQGQFKSRNGCLL